MSLMYLTLQEFLLMSFVLISLSFFLALQVMTVQLSNHIQQLDRAYLDPRGVPVQVTGYDREQQQVIFRRQNYEHECMRPVWQFQQFFTRVSA